MKKRCKGKHKICKTLLLSRELPVVCHLASNPALAIFATVKTISAILSLYFLLLSAVPCCLEDTCSDEIYTEETGPCSQDQEDCDNSPCSPFFTCGACAGFVFSTAQLNLKELTTVKIKWVNGYHPQFIDDFVAKIWQPPKVG